MNLLSELRGVKSRVQELEANQKEVEQIGSPSGCGSSFPPASQRIGSILFEVEKLYMRVFSLQEKVINNITGYNEGDY